MSTPTNLIVAHAALPSTYKERFPELVKTQCEDFNRKRKMDSSSCSEIFTGLGRMARKRKTEFSSACTEDTKPELIKELGPDLNDLPNAADTSEESDDTSHLNVKIQLFDDDGEKYDTGPHALYRRKLPTLPPYESEEEELGKEYEDEDVFLKEFEEEVVEVEYKVEIGDPILQIEEAELEDEEEDFTAESESSEDVMPYDEDNNDEEEVPLRPIC
jgi:hypothetical protein